MFIQDEKIEVNTYILLIESYKGCKLNYVWDNFIIILQLFIDAGLDLKNLLKYFQNTLLLFLFI